MPAYTPFTQSAVKALLKGAGSFTGEVAKSSRYATVGGGILAYGAIKHTSNFFGGNSLRRPGVDISDPTAAGDMFGSTIPNLNTSDFFDDLGRGYNIMFHPDKQGIKKSARNTIAGAAATTATLSGVSVGLIALAVTKSPSTAVTAGVAAGAGGLYVGSKFAVNASRSLGTIAKSYYGLNPVKMDQRSYGGGRGYRTWYKRPGGRLTPGHMGADGTLPLAMHKIRNRSIRM